MKQAILTLALLLAGCSHTIAWSDWSDAYVACKDRPGYMPWIIRDKRGRVTEVRCLHYRSDEDIAK